MRVLLRCLLVVALLYSATLLAAPTTVLSSGTRVSKFLASGSGGKGLTRLKQAAALTAHCC